MLRTPEQFVEDLRDGRVVYQDGERVSDVPSLPAYKRAVEHAASEYYIALQPENRELFNVVKDGEEYPFVYHVPKTGEDLQRRRLIIQTLFRSAAGGTKFTGIDGLNGIAYSAKKMDLAIGTNYAEHVEEFRNYCQKHDPGIVATMTDVKGNRSLHPEDPRQTHPDFYVRIVDRNSDGIVIRGAKVHITDAIYANWLVVLPSRNFDEPAKDYAVACAVPCNAKGVIFIGTMSDMGQPGAHPMIIFDDVFVPWDKVFLAGEWQFSREVATSFARYHRLTAATYKTVMLQVAAGTAMLMAEHNGLTRATRIRDMLAWLAMYAEVNEALGKAAALDATIDPEIGLAAPNPVYTNCAKFWFAENWHQAVKYLQDITGGLPATMPSLKDWDNPEIRPYLEKYLQGAAEYPAEERIRLMNAVNREASSFMGLLTIHAEGSLAAQRMTVFAQADWERFKAAARHSMGLPTDHPDFKDLPTEPVYKLP